ncbi:hypothetical protein CVT26_007531 [Gymnopilus dilepis]|uniref:F-box domain-containing protein n=1 Tax=Gymnopilus dilepis TaxID=231916 RepID=A0A409W8C6_9AGAR|nr:hypothetical protein CVT26_007531 [Gymnopilus dilepis]
MPRLLDRLCIRSTPRPPSVWDGFPNLIEEFAYHLHRDTDALRRMSIVSRLFSHAAQKVLFQSISIMDGYTVEQWRLRLRHLKAYHKKHPTRPFFLFIKELSFSLIAYQYQNPSVVDLILELQVFLINLETIRVFGYDGLLCIYPDCKWFSDLVNLTGPAVLSFNGTLIPEYIMEFSYPTVRRLEFHCCRIFYTEEELPPDLPRQPFLDARVILSADGKGWNRVKEIVSTALNSETLHLVKGAKGLDQFVLRAVFNQLRTTPDMELKVNITNISRLVLRVPPFSLIEVPWFIQEIVPQAFFLEEMEIFYEEGWEELFRLNTIFDVAERAGTGCRNHPHHGSICTPSAIRRT